MNRLYYGDNLEVLRDAIADASVDLIYLDPPFNSNASYNILFKSPAGTGADASIEAFGDTWQWGPTAAGAIEEVIASGNHRLIALLRAMRDFVGENAMMAYLAMMAVRLVELHRVLKPTGSLYLHCDPTASHYLKLVLDAVFGVENYRAEIAWRRTNARGTSENWPHIHDIIFCYIKNGGFTFNQQIVLGDVGRTPHTLIKAVDGKKYNTLELTGAGRTKLGESGKPWRGFDPNTMGRHWGYNHSQLEEWAMSGLIHFPAKGGFPRKLAKEPFDPASRPVSVGDVWTDIDRLNQTSKERLGYPTQKPLALLERIIAASSNPGDVVLDPFCGCGTAIDAAEKLGRRWIGIDVTHLAIGLVEKRLRERYEGIRFETIGVPRDLASALRLAAEKPHEFQNWITLKVGGYPFEGGRKGADKGRDGHFYFRPDAKGVETGVISVKAGHNVGPTMVRDLQGVMEANRNPMGLFLCAVMPTRAMEDAALQAGFYECEWGRFQRLQIFTLAELFADRLPRLPPLVPSNQRARRHDARPQAQTGAQPALDV